MEGNFSYAQILRTVGQMLEALDVQSFVLTAEGDDYKVSAPRTDKLREPVQTSLRFWWRRLRGADSHSNGAPSSGVLELHYTSAEIARKDFEGQGRRSGAGSPEPHAISQVLRAVGGFIDQKQGRLIEVRQEDQNIQFEYESRLHTRLCERFTVATLYDYWVKMYLKRSGRPAPKG
jgi:hypothetical protein